MCFKCCRQMSMSKFILLKITNINVHIQHMFTVWMFIITLSVFKFISRKE